MIILNLKSNKKIYLFKRKKKLVGCQTLKWVDDVGISKKLAKLLGSSIAVQTHIKKFY